MKCAYDGLVFEASHFDMLYKCVCEDVDLCRLLTLFVEYDIIDFKQLEIFVHI